MRTRKTGREDIPALKALWQEAFGDEQQDIDLFFETVYPNATGFCAEDGGELVSMLFALPQTIVKEEKQLKCAYLYAVATKKDRQGEGLCSALLAYAEKELRKRYVEALLLSPASERLADFYAERGFTRQTGAKKRCSTARSRRGRRRKSVCRTTQVCARRRCGIFRMCAMTERSWNTRWLAANFTA